MVTFVALVFTRQSYFNPTLKTSQEWFSFKTRVGAAWQTEEFSASFICITFPQSIFAHLKSTKLLKTLKIGREPLKSHQKYNFSLFCGFGGKDLSNFCQLGDDTIDEKTVSGDFDGYRKLKQRDIKPLERWLNIFCNDLYQPGNFAMKPT